MVLGGTIRQIALRSRDTVKDRPMLLSRRYDAPRHDQGGVSEQRRGPVTPIYGVDQKAVMCRIPDRRVKDLVAARCINPFPIFLRQTLSFQQLAYQTEPSHPPTVEATKDGAAVRQVFGGYFLFQAPHRLAHRSPRRPQRLPERRLRQTISRAYIAQENVIADGVFGGSGGQIGSLRTDSGAARHRRQSSCR